ncbi:MAG: hypothetical protein G3H99_01000 [Ferrovum sp.]|nr:hypothetical protein [Ferrovum sp.]NDU87514.1 hypothetical protein [Ferrovum sp.]
MSRLYLFFSLLGILWVHPAWAEPDQEDGLRILRQMGTAAHDQAYSGVYVMQRGSVMESAHVAHAVINGVERTRVDILDGHPRQIIRTAEETRCYYPMQKKVRLEKGFTRRLFPALIEAPYEHYADFYEVSQRGMNRVAGRDCQRIYFHARDRQRYDHEFCADAQTHLILKAVTYDLQKQPIETLLFTEISEGPRPSVDSLKTTYDDVTQWQQVHFPLAGGDKEADRWSIPVIPPGFKKILEMSLVAKGPSSGAMQHWVYSDGLSSFSVFVKSAEEGEGHGSQARILSSALSYYSGFVGNQRVVVLGEVPQETAVAIGQSIRVKEEISP